MTCSLLSDIDGPLLTLQRLSEREANCKAGELRGGAGGLVIIKHQHEAGCSFAMGYMFGGQWIVTACHVIPTLQILYESAFSFHELQGDPLHIPPSSQDMRQGWFMWNSPADLGSSVPDLTIVRLPRLQQHAACRNVNMALLIHGDALVKQPQQVAIWLALSYGSSIATAHPELEVHISQAIIL